MTRKDELKAGDRIKCKDPDDAANTAVALGAEGYLWDFEYHEGPSGTAYYVIIEGREDEHQIQ